jgi:hypothetical protein
VALGWNLAKEGFFPFKGTFNELKVRGSYGLNGNQAIDAYASLPQFIVANYQAGSEAEIGYKPSQMGIDDLGWESSLTLNLGMDFGLFKGRISGNFDWYLTNTQDLLLSRSISVIHGITPYTHLPDWEHPSVTENIGETQNSGIEVVINSRNIIGNKFQWFTTGNFSYNKNKIVSLYGKLDGMEMKLMIFRINGSLDSLLMLTMILSGTGCGSLVKRQQPKYTDLSRVK